MDDMIAVAVKDNDPRFRGYLPFIPASSSVRMSTLVVLDGPESTESLDILTDDEAEINGKYPPKQGYYPSLPQQSYHPSSAPA